MPVHDRSAMTFHLSRGKLIGSLDLTTPLEAECPVGCPSGHIAAPLTSAIVIRQAANAGAEARVPDASKQHRTARRACAREGVSRATSNPRFGRRSRHARPVILRPQVPASKSGSGYTDRSI